MAYSAVPTVSSGDLWTAANHNTYVKDNFAAGVPDIFTAKGDIAVASAADTAIPLAVGTYQQVLVPDTSASGGLAWATQFVGTTTAIVADASGLSAGTYTTGFSNSGSLPATAKALMVYITGKWGTAADGTKLHAYLGASNIHQVVVASQVNNISNIVCGILYPFTTGTTTCKIVITGNTPAVATVTVTGWII